jgi:hypothetical protein
MRPGKMLLMDGVHVVGIIFRFPPDRRLFQAAMLHAWVAGHKPPKGRRKA